MFSADIPVFNHDIGGYFWRFWKILGGASVSIHCVLIAACDLFSYGESPSNFAFKFILRRYSAVDIGRGDVFLPKETSRIVVADAAVAALSVVGRP
jgi:hypothetical protein